MNETKDQDADHASLVRSLGQMTMRLQEVNQAFDEAVGARNNLSTVELRALSTLMAGERTAGEIAKTTGLKPSSVTSLIDRLERTGYLGRKSDPADRRKVVLEATSKAHALAATYYGGLAKAGEEMLASHSISELTLLSEVMGKMVVIQEEAIRNLPAQDS